MKSIINNIYKRLKEPSTQAVITTGLLGLGLNLDETIIQSGIFVLAGITGLLGFFLPEGDK